MMPYLQGRNRWIYSCCKSESVHLILLMGFELLVSKTCSAPSVALSIRGLRVRRGTVAVGMGIQI